MMKKSTQGRVYSPNKSKDKKIFFSDGRLEKVREESVDLGGRQKQKRSKKPKVTSLRQSSRETFY